LAHLDGQALKSALCAECPTLAADWSSFYQEKRAAYFELLGSQEAELMPGVTELLAVLQTQEKRRCVVTNSPYDQIEVTRSRTPMLQTIPHWITREDYAAAKPAPDGYLRAIELHGKLGDRIIGFEDSIRGLRSLMQTPALPVLICPDHYPLLNMAIGQAHHFRSFAEIPSSFHI
jgi:beta-phosphoglucomutase